MNYKTLLSPTSPKLAELEERLGKEGVRPERRRRPGERSWPDGRRSGGWPKLTEEEFELLFWSMAYKDKVSGCWEWMGAKNPTGYGFIRKFSNKVAAHRTAAELIIGRKTTKWVLHKCDNPSCINPSHLFLGTVKDNVMDMVAKGRNVSVGGERHGTAKLKWSEVLKIRGMKLGVVKTGEMFNVSKSLVSAIRLNRIWKHP